MMENCNYSPTFRHCPGRRLLYTLLLTISSIPLCFCEIKNTRIVHDSRPMIIFERFGFSRGGMVSVSLDNVSYKLRKNKRSQFIPSSMGFFLATDASFPQMLNESQYICALSSRFVKIVFNFENLARATSYSDAVTIDDSDEYILLFANCQPEFEVTMEVQTEMFNIRNGGKDFLPAGQTNLPRLYFIFFLIYTCLVGLWVFICVKHRATVHKIHIIMAALLLTKALKTICAAEDKLYVSQTGTPHGWDVAFYIFGFFKGIMLFTVIILIGTGWSFLKPYLQEREKNVLMTVIPLQVLENIAYVVISETGPATRDFMAWNQMFLLIDIICCCAVFVPIIWSIRGLREASKTDGKAAKNLEKLTLFKQFYVVVVGYLYFTRIVVTAMGAILNYKYEWIMNVSAEAASLFFYVFIFYNFQPIEKNPYLLIDEVEDNVEMEQLEDGDEEESYEI